MGRKKIESIIKKENKRKYNIAYYIKNFDKAKTYKNNWYLKNKNKILEKQKEYCFSNRLKIANYKKKYREENIDKLRSESKIYYLRNKQKIINKTKEYYNNNKKKIREKQKIYNINNSEMLRATEKRWRLKNIDRVNSTCRKYQRYKLKNNIQFRLTRSLRSSLRCRLRKYINGTQKIGSAVHDLGCSIPELKIYLEKQFQPGMTWDNWALRGWHIDHKKPLSLFDLTNRNQFLEACHYTNLQPMWWRENIIKSNKIQ